MASVAISDSDQWRHLGAASMVEELAVAGCGAQQ
jgi:hypothetical protein